ncbi:MAG: helix-turn-helix domain-containing protein [Halobacteriales archaeon]
MNPTAAKIVLAAQRGDSINKISKKIRISYSWTYEWIERLEANNIIVNTDNGIEIVDHEMRRHYRDMVATLIRKDGVTPDMAYMIPHFAGMEFAFTEIDAAFVWTHGGYQIARSHDDYPIFIQVHDQDVERWMAFFEMFGMSTAINERPPRNEVESNVYCILYPTRDGIDQAWVDGNPVIPLDDAVEQMMGNRAAYEPALEIIADEHGLAIDASHHEPMAAD